MRLSGIQIRSRPPDMRRAWLNLGLMLTGTVAGAAPDPVPSDIEALRSEMRAHEERVRSVLSSGTNAPADPVAVAWTLVQADTNSAAAWSAYAEACWAARRGDDALAAATQASQLDPRHAAAWLMLGRLREAAGRTEQALQDYQRACDLDAGQWMAWAGRGRCLQELERMREAGQAFERAVALRTNSAVLHLNLAVCRDLSGEVTGAETAFREAVRLASEASAVWDDPASGRADAWMKFAIFLDRRNRPDEVIAVYRDGTARVPESAALWRTLGDALNARLRFDEADEALARARALEKR